jgi:hypothetical protein
MIIQISIYYLKDFNKQITYLPSLSTVCGCCIIFLL